MAFLRFNTKCLVFLLLLILLWTIRSKPGEYRHENNTEEDSTMFTNKEDFATELTDWSSLAEITTEESVSSRKIEFSVENCSVQINVPECHCTKALPLSTCQVSDVGTYTVVEDEKTSTCSRLATVRGPGQKVVSFSLYGQYPEEVFSRLKRLLSRVGHVYPSWVVRLYLDLGTRQHQAWACYLSCNNQYIDFCNVQNLPGIGNISGSSATTWSYSVMGDPLVDYYMIRDVDSPILQREVDAVAQWLQSGRCYHVMRDSKHLSVPIMDGAWGGCNTWEPDRAITTRNQLFETHGQNQLLNTYGQTHFGPDQQVLSTFLWPWIQDDALVHDSYTCTKYPGSVPFPSQRVNNTFVGMRPYNHDIPEPCPIECRPADHQDWEHC